MKHFKRLLPPVLMLIAAACSETAGPLEPVAQEPGTQLGRQLVPFANAMVPDQFTAVELTTDGEIPLTVASKPVVMFDGRGRQLSNYEVSFWAKKGKDREIRIDYLDPNNGKPKWRDYFKLKVRKESLLALSDGTPIAKGDSVLITAVVDPVYMAVSLEPSGLQFDVRKPVELEWKYKGAAEDVNGDGVVDDVDEAILDNLVMLWQHEKGDPWYEMVFKHDRGGKKITALLYHFSGYAVSW
jgi:hypothetical protein